MKPGDFQVNQAWIAIRANTAPFKLAEGAFNLFVLMDAGSEFIFGQKTIPAEMDVPSLDDVEALFKQGWDHCQQWPTLLLIENGAWPSGNAFEHVAQLHGITVRPMSPLELAALTEGFREGIAKMEARANQTANVAEDRSRSPYAPIRLQESPAWHFARSALADGMMIADGRISSEFYPQLRGSLIDPMLDQIGAGVRSGQIPNDGNVIGPLVAKIQSYAQWVPLIAQYEGSGRQIFDLHDKLTELLLHTDLNETTLANLHTPYPAFFVRFGRQDQVRLRFEANTFEYVDGAFVAYAPWDEAGSLRLKIGFTMVHLDGQQVGYPGPFFDILPNELAMPVNEGIAAALHRRLGDAGDDPNDDNNARGLKSHLRAEIEDSAELMRHCASLLINALFYLESIEHHLPEPTPGRDTPPDLVAMWMSKPLKRYKFQSKLRAEGYAVVRLVGAEIETPTQKDGGDAGHSVRVHWRRGHWRMQPYGPQRESRRRIWIKPILVGGDALVKTTYGHIYVPPGATSNRVQ